ncbi:class I SAM-dependent methyltransferase [Pseudomonas sp. MBLB4136]|uniref:class I SAM-dependent methyltransferase n=1 Tax=Pseudomonas sp. MBLB4136 TaxID=3451558 RepID=UPI003F74FB9C
MLGPGKALPASAATAIAQEKAAERAIGTITSSKATLNKLAVPAQSLDAVLGLNILHLLDDWDEAIGRVEQMLKPGGVFISSTMCLGDSLKLKAMKCLVSMGAWLGLLPSLSAFSQQQLLDSLTRAGFSIERHWQPGKKNRAVFIVARKA